MDGMEYPSAGAAVTGGWSAIEALLIRPGEGSRQLAADRLASLIACSLPRDELTPLAYRHLENANDNLAQALSKAHTNFDKVQTVESHLREGHPLRQDPTPQRPSRAAGNAVIRTFAKCVGGASATLNPRRRGRDGSPW